MGDGRILGGRVGYELKRAQHALRLEMDGALREVGSTTPQYAALSVVEGEEGLSGALLAWRCFVTPQTMNGILVNLEKAGLLERRAHPEYGRVLQAYLTGDGEGMLSRAHALVEAIEGRMFGALTEGERARLLAMLRGCADALERSDGRPLAREAHAGGGSFYRRSNVLLAGARPCPSPRRTRIAGE